MSEVHKPSKHTAFFFLRHKWTDVNILSKKYSIEIVMVASKVKMFQQ